MIANADRVFPDKWALGEYPEDTEDKTLTFGESDNCLSVLQHLCREYGTEFDIEQVNGVNTIHFGKAGQIFPYTFEYGKGKGLYSLERQNVSSANIVTRLKVYGGTRNISYKYRASRLCLSGKTKGESCIEKPDAVAKYGIWEATKYFDHIYPSRTGTITGAVSGSVLKFVDKTMNFDLNEKEADGKTTRYLLDGISPKIHFNSGNLSGFEFELQTYDHAAKTFTLKPFKDERDEAYPAEKSAAYQFSVGDKYKILDIALPQSYIDDAEVQLADEGDTYYDQNNQPKVQYSLEVAEEFLKELAGNGGTANIFQVGDYLPVKDSDIDADKSVRIQAFTRDLINEYKYRLTISDTVTTSITNRVISELIDIDKVIKINNLNDPARARRDWRSAQELLDMIFDVEGDYYTDKIKPGSIETQMLSVGAKSTQFGLIGTIIQANYNGNKNFVKVTGGVLSHYTIDENGRIWNLADNTTTLTGDGTPYYIYAKCQRVGSAGSVIFSTSQVKVEQDPDFYHFFIGIVNSVDAEANARSVALTYGFTTINGRFVRTGRIQSNDGATYFDLDAGEIGGKITFRSSGGSQTDLSDWSDGITGDIRDAQQSAAEAEAKARQAIDDAAANVTDYNAKFEEVHKQIDGEVSNWFYAYSPTLGNYPASDWTTDELKDRHVGDTFTNTQPAPAEDAGKSWRFVKNGAVYSWTQIADSDAVKALLQAAQAQATADGKSTTFLVQPSNYHLGDTWVLNADRTLNGTAYKQGEILTATQNGTAFNEAHWTKRVRYTDDTAVDNIKIGGRNLIRRSKGTFKVNSTLFWERLSLVKEELIAGETYVVTASDYVNEYGGGGVMLTDHSNTDAQYITIGVPFVLSAPKNYFALTNNGGGKLISVTDVKLEKGNKPTDWTPAPEDIEAEVNKVKAVTDKFGTTIDGGLIGTVMILLRELNSAQETAGLSGIQGALRDNPAFWAGGTYAQALALIRFLSKMSSGTAPGSGEYANLAKITLLHNGAAKVGDFIVEESGRVVMIDPATGKERLMFTVYNLPTIADLMSGTVFQGSTNIGAVYMSSPGSQILSGSVNVTKDGATATFAGVKLDLSGTGKRSASDAVSGVSVTLYGRRNGIRTMQLARHYIFFDNTGDYVDRNESLTVPATTINTIQAGLYTFELVFEKSGDVKLEKASSSDSAFSWKFTQKDVNYQQYGLDGMMFFYSNRHFHFTEGGGLDVRGSTNIPGVLAAGSSTSGGSHSNVWGAKSNAGGVTIISGGFRVPLSNMSHNKYVVQITPHTNTTFRVGARTNTYFEIFGTGGFDYVVIGNNYM